MNVVYVAYLGLVISLFNLYINWRNRSNRISPANLVIQGSKENHHLVVRVENSPRRSISTKTAFDVSVQWYFGDEKEGDWEDLGDIPCEHISSTYMFAAFRPGKPSLHVQWREKSWFGKQVQRNATFSLSF